MLKSAVRPFHLGASLLSSIKELVQIVRKPDLSSAELGLLRSLCCTILYRAVDAIINPMTPPKQHMMDEAIRFIEANYSKKSDADDLIRHMGYGRTQLYALFKKHTGLTPNEYLVRFRIATAQDLLNKKTPPEEVASAVGFSSFRYFKKVFLKYTGQSL